MRIPRQVPQAFLRRSQGWSSATIYTTKSRYRPPQTFLVVQLSHDIRNFRVLTTASSRGTANSTSFGHRRLFFTAPNSSQQAIKPPTITTGKHTPPLAVRTALVATTTAIGTPAFPVIGAVNFALRWVVWDSNTRYAVLGATTVLGGMATLLTMAANDWMPFVYSYSQLFLPFAMVNGALAGTAYAALDAALGTAAIVRKPWAGAALGALVGFVGPVSSLYDKAFQWLYDVPEVDGVFTAFLSNGFILPISITTGLGVGFILHPLLYFPIVGIPSVHWATFSAPFLAGATLFMAYLYHGDYFDDDIFPPETYLTTEERQHLMLVQRFRADRLEAQDWAQGIGYKPVGSGIQARSSVEKKLQAVQTNSNRRTDMVFDSRRKAWLHYTTNGWIGENMAVRSVPTEQEIKQCSSRLLLGDGATSFVLLFHQGGRPHNNKQSSNGNKKDIGLATVREGLLRLAERLQNSSSSRNPGRDEDNHRAKRTVDQIELVSCGIAILFAERFKDKKLNTSNSTTNSASTNPQQLTRERKLEKLERGIRRIAPGILLYRQDEGDGFEGCSVESQLEEFGWDGSLLKEPLKKDLWLKWKAGYDNKQRQVIAEQLLWAATGLSLALLIGLVGGQG